MSSKRAQRRNACTGKVRYDSFAAARQAMQGMLRVKGNDGWRLEPYRCKFCGGYHFGHVPLKVLQSRRDARNAQFRGFQ